MESFNMIIQAKLAKELAAEFNWEKFELDNIITGILGVAKVGAFSYSYYPRREVNEKIIMNISEVLRKYGYKVSDIDPYSRILTISWN